MTVDNSRTSTPEIRGPTFPNLDKIKDQDLCAIMHSFQDMVKTFSMAQEEDVAKLIDSTGIRTDEENAAISNRIADYDSKVLWLKNELFRAGNCRITSCDIHYPTIDNKKKRPFSQNDSANSSDDEQIRPTKQKLNATLTKHGEDNSLNATPKGEDKSPKKNATPINGEDVKLKKTEKLNDGFMYPSAKQTVRPPTPIAVPPIVNANRFQPLNSIQATPTLQSPDIDQTKEKPPAIMVKTNENFKTICELISSFVKDQPDFKIIGDLIKVSFKSIDDYRTGTSKMTQAKIGYYIITPLKSRPLKVVIKGIHREYKAEEVQKELISLGYQVEKVVQLRRFKDRFPLPIFQILITPGPKMDDIYALTRFQYLSVSVEKFERTGRVNQCFRCQSFFHSSETCHFQARCVKCGENHESKTCIKVKETPATCCNCGGPHPASYRGCSKFPKWIKNQQHSSSQNQPRKFTTNHNFAWGKPIHTQQPAPSTLNDQNFPKLESNRHFNRNEPTSSNLTETTVNELIGLVKELRSEIQTLKRQLADQQEQFALLAANRA